MSGKEKTTRKHTGTGIRNNCRKSGPVDREMSDFLFFFFFFLVPGPFRAGPSIGMINTQGDSNMRIRKDSER